MNYTDVVDKRAKLCQGQFQMQENNYILCNIKSDDIMLVLTSHWNLGVAARPHILNAVSYTHL